MKTPKVGEVVKLTKPVPLPSPDPMLVFNPSELTSEDTLIFMGVQEGKWRVLAHVVRTSTIGPSGVTNAQFLIPVEFFQ